MYECLCMRMDFFSGTWDSLMLIYAISSLRSQEKVFPFHQRGNKGEKRIRKQTERNIRQRKKILFGTMAKGVYKQKRIIVIWALKKILNEVALWIKADTEQNQIHCASNITLRKSRKPKENTGRGSLLTGDFQTNSLSCRNHLLLWGDSQMCSVRKLDAHSKRQRALWKSKGRRPHGCNLMDSNPTHAHRLFDHLHYAYDIHI